VLGVLNREQWPEKFNVIVEDNPVPVVGATCNWTDSVRRLHKRVLSEGPDAILNLDDDQIFTDDGLSEIAGHLNVFTEDRYDYRTLFMWDSLDTYNERFPEHWSSNLFRAYPDDVWATKVVQHCPQEVSRSPYVVRLSEPAVNFGYINEPDRLDYWQRYKRAGKVDAHTLALIREPHLKEFKWQSKERTLSAFKP